MADMATLEKKVHELERLVHEVPDLLKVRFDGMDAKLTTAQAEREALSVRLTTVELKVDALTSKVDVLPRVLAELINNQN